MADDQEPPDDERAIELSAISSIYQELVIDLLNPFAASLEISAKLVNPLSAVFPPLVEAALPTPPPSDDARQDGPEGDEGPELAVRSLSYLPPLKLFVELPSGYPSEVGPKVTLHSREPYLTDETLKGLQNEAQKLWEENGHSEVLYDYIDFLHQAAENAFDLAPPNGPLRLPQDLELALLDFDLQAKKAEFDQETFDCGVCLEPKKGAVCHRLTMCGHVFCKSCLQDFYNNCITEGDIHSVKCINPSCEKEMMAKHSSSTDQKKKKKKPDLTLSPSELLQIPIEQEQVQRYIAMKRKKEQDANKNIIFCPRKWCQGVARTSSSKAEDEEDEESSDPEPETEEDGEEKEKELPPPNERLAVCTECSYAFCSVCRLGWHGEIVYCMPPRKLAELTAEEKASIDYLDLHSTRCPTCDSRAQKSMGCNHMRCAVCLTHFCYICSAWLEADNPYSHFNTEGTPCYQRLWEMEEGDNEGLVPHVFAPAAPGRNANANANANQQRINHNHNHNQNHNNHNNNNNNNDPRPERPPPRARRPPPPAPAPPAADNAPPWEAPPAVRFRQRAQQGLVRDANRPPVQAHPHNNGLQRFLAMVQDDREDEWDSDEMEDDDNWEIPIRAR